MLNGFDVVVVLVFEIEVLDEGMLVVLCVVVVVVPCVVAVVVSCAVVPVVSCVMVVVVSCVVASATLSASNVTVEDADSASRPESGLHPPNESRTAATPTMDNSFFI